MASHPDSHNGASWMNVLVDDLMFIWEVDSCTDSGPQHDLDAGPVGPQKCFQRRHGLAVE